MKGGTSQVFQNDSRQRPAKSSANHGAQCLLGVKLGCRNASAACLLHPEKRKFTGEVTGHSRTGRSKACFTFDRPGL
jgi:hypothetical protein